VTPGYQARWKVNQEIPVEPIEHLIVQPDITKLLVKPADPTGWNSDTWLAEVAPLIGDRLQATHASQDVVLAEVAAHGVTKGAAIASLAEELGLTAEDIAAVGDMPNDVSMLEWVGEAWAVANAHPEVLAVTNNRLPHHDESPVAQLIADLLSRN
jgi:hydroxymethylpyrimidine pyrophosphatase-like HAD family hydrolase